MIQVRIRVGVGMGWWLRGHVQPVCLDALARQFKGENLLVRLWPVQWPDPAPQGPYAPGNPDVPAARCAA